ncbi:hypothetical protein AX15_001593 [Amanita polypyramis BW_CC]|nr:hypothetical protein AX15_001593 [Amanita polypyramis BW_CC]
MFNLPVSFSARLTILSLLLFSAFDICYSHTVSRRATVCNGHAELCNRGYGNVSFVGAHDSYAIGPTTTLGANQDQNITRQLDDGIRMLQMQAHLQNNQIYLCHTSCAIQNGGSLHDYLTTVKAWLDNNPNEVLTLLIVNVENLQASQYDSVFKTAGLDTISFVPQSTPLQASQWPTLGSMIDSGKRLVTFLDNGADTSYPYLLDEFTQIWETAYDVTNLPFDCSVNRTKGDSSTQMYLINHFLDTLLLNQDVPDVSRLNVTNSASGTGSLEEQASTCTTQLGRAPNFMLVDFYEFGNGSVFQVAANLNGVGYSPTTPIATPSPTSTAGAQSSSGNGAGSMTRLVEGNLVIALLVVTSSIVLGACTVL